MEKLKSELNKMNRRLQKRANMIQEHQKGIDIQKNDALKKVKDLQNRKEVLLKQIEEIDQELVNATGKVESLTDDVKMFNELSDKCVVTSKNVHELLQSPCGEILHGFLKQELLIEQLLSDIDRVNTENINST